MNNDPKITEARKMLINYLNEIRQSQGVTYQQVADRCHLHQSNVVRFFKADTAPTLDTFITIAEALNYYLFAIEKDSDDDLAKMMKSRWKNENEAN